MKIDDGCPNLLPASTKCKMYFRFKSIGIAENSAPMLGIISNLITFPFNDRDVVNPQVFNAEVKNSLIEKNFLDRVNISAEIVSPGKLELFQIIDNEGIGIRDTIAQETDTHITYEFEPQETSSSKGKKVSITFENTGSFDVSDIEVIDPNQSSEIIVDRSSCPGRILAESPQKCEIEISTSSQKPGIYEKELLVNYYNGVNYVSTRIVGIKASFANTANLSAKILIDKSSIFTQLNSQNNEFIYDLPTPDMRLELTNYGKSAATIENFIIDQDLSCQTFTTKVTVKDFNEANCTDTPISSKGEDGNSCHISFKLEFDHQHIESLLNTKPFNEECELNYSFNFKDEFYNILSHTFDEDSDFSNWTIEKTEKLKLGEGQTYTL